MKIAGLKARQKYSRDVIIFILFFKKATTLFPGGTRSIDDP
jgi:hypothetical protein